MRPPSTFFGPRAWSIMKMYAHERCAIPGQPTTEEKIDIDYFYKEFILGVLYCGICKMHYLHRIHEYPPEPERLPEWQCDLHNYVNELTEKPIHPWSSVEREYQNWTPKMKSHYLDLFLEMYVFESLLAAPNNQANEEERARVHTFLQGNDFIFGQFMIGVDYYRILVKRYPPDTSSNEALGKWYMDIRQRMTPKTKLLSYKAAFARYELNKIEALRLALLSQQKKQIGEKKKRGVPIVEPTKYHWLVPPAIAILILIVIVYVLKRRQQQKNKR